MPKDNSNEIRMKIKSMSPRRKVNFKFHDDLPRVDADLNDLRMLPDTVKYSISLLFMPYIIKDNNSKSYIVIAGHPQYILQQVSDFTRHYILIEGINDDMIAHLQKVDSINNDRILSDIDKLINPKPRSANWTKRDWAFTRELICPFCGGAVRCFCDSKPMSNDVVTVRRCRMSCWETIEKQRNGDRRCTFEFYVNSLVCDEFNSGLYPMTRWIKKLEGKSCIKCKRDLYLLTIPTELGITKLVVCSSMFDLSVTDKCGSGMEHEEWRALPKK